MSRKIAASLSVETGAGAAIDEDKDAEEPPNKVSLRPEDGVVGTEAKDVRTELDADMGREAALTEVGRDPALTLEGREDEWRELDGPVLSPIAKS
jgi:hypothetical protein